MTTKYLVDDRGENSIMQTISIAVSVILIAAGLVTAPGLINNARDNNARGDLANIAYAQEFALGNDGQYYDTIPALGLANGAEGGIKLTLSGGNMKYAMDACVGADGQQHFLAAVKSTSGNTFFRSESSATTTRELGDIDIDSCIDLATLIEEVNSPSTTPGDGTDTPPGEGGGSENPGEDGLSALALNGNYANLKSAVGTGSLTNENQPFDCLAKNEEGAYIEASNVVMKSGSTVINPQGKWIIQKYNQYGLVIIVPMSVTDPAVPNVTFPSAELAFNAYKDARWEVSLPNCDAPMQFDVTTEKVKDNYGLELGYTPEGYVATPNPDFTIKAVSNLGGFATQENALRDAPKYQFIKNIDGKTPVYDVHAFLDEKELSTTDSDWAISYKYGAFTVENVGSKTLNGDTETLNKFLSSGGVLSFKSSPDAQESMNVEFNVKYFTAGHQENVDGRLNLTMTNDLSDGSGGLYGRIARVEVSSASGTVIPAGTQIRVTMGDPDQLPGIDNPFSDYTPDDTAYWFSHGGRNIVCDFSTAGTDFARYKGVVTTYCTVGNDIYPGDTSIAEFEIGSPFQTRSWGALSMDLMLPNDINASNDHVQVAMIGSGTPMGNQPVVDFDYR